MRCANSRQLHTNPRRALFAGLASLLTALLLPSAAQAIKSVRIDPGTPNGVWEQQAPAVFYSKTPLPFSFDLLGQRVDTVCISYYGYAAFGLGDCNRYLYLPGLTQQQIADTGEAIIAPTVGSGSADVTVTMDWGGRPRKLDTSGTPVPLRGDLTVGHYPDSANLVQSVTAYSAFRITWTYTKPNAPATTNVIQLVVWRLNADSSAGAISANTIIEISFGGAFTWGTYSNATAGLYGAAGRHVGLSEAAGGTSPLSNCKLLGLTAGQSGCTWYGPKNTNLLTAYADNFDTGTSAAVTGRHIFNLAPDTDGDSITDSLDNCSQFANADQRDTDLDGYGNACDADLNNDGIVNFSDLAVFRGKFGSPFPNADFDGNGLVDFADLARFRQLFGKAAGPGVGPPPDPAPGMDTLTAIDVPNPGQPLYSTDPVNLRTYMAYLRDGNTGFSVGTPASVAMQIRWYSDIQGNLCTIDLRLSPAGACNVSSLQGGEHAIGYTVSVGGNPPYYGDYQYVSVVVPGSVQVGANGSNGSNGSSGDPGASGHSGTNGAASGVTIATTGTYNNAYATGGNGGAGGNGGNGVDGPDLGTAASGGSGGGGGAGGQAAASATTAGYSNGQADVRATGGNGGDGGRGGAAAGAGTTGAGGSAGAGGNAYSSAAVSGSSQDALSWSRADVTARANGGQGGISHARPGGLPGGRGGNASSTATGSAFGPASLNVYSFAGGGQGGDADNGATAGDGGDAYVFALGNGEDGRVSISAGASGGWGGSNLVAGGTGGNGASVDLVDRVGGSSRFQLELNQSANGGHSGFSEAGGTPGQAGNASSILNATNPAGGGLLAVADATGGGGWNTVTKASGGSAVAQVVASLPSSALVTPATYEARAFAAAGDVYDNLAYATGPPPRGGDATAVASTLVPSAISHHATSTATARAGRDGNASALANATGVDPLATADSATFDSITPLLGTRAEVMNLSTTGSRFGGNEARALTAYFNDTLHIISPILLETANAYAAAMSIPGPFVAPLIIGNSNVIAALPPTTALAAAYAQLGGSHPPVEQVDNISISSQMDLQFDPTQSTRGGPTWMLGFLNPVVLGNGFVSLHFQVLVENQVVVDRSFSQAADANAYFDDVVETLGALTGGTNGIIEFQVRVDMEIASAGDGYYLNFIVGR